MSQGIAYFSFKASVAFCVILTWSLALPPMTFAAGLSVNGYNGIIVPDADNDPYRIGAEIRRQAQALGFGVYLTADSVPEAEALRTCWAQWSWRDGEISGRVQMRLLDYSTGRVVAEGSRGFTAWVSVKNAVRAGVRRLWESIGYRGFSDAVHQSNVKQLFPPRPKIELTETELRARSLDFAIEGIWVDPENRYRIGIIESPEGGEFKFVGVVLDTTHPGWNPNEIKMELNPTASPSVFIGNYYRGDKKRNGTSFLFENDAVLTFEMKLSSGEKQEVLLVRAWPQVADSAGSGREGEGAVTGTGTGFFVSVAGLVATNWHVVDGAKRIYVYPLSNPDGYGARVAIKDPINDLAVLRLDDYIPAPEGCVEMPYSIESARRVALGQKVVTIGYPLSSLLGSSPKYTEGVISSRSGIQDDPRTFQFDATIQPGSSGSPLLDPEGHVLGVVVASLNASYLYKKIETLPQNVNFAIKSDYLLNLLAMLPDRLDSGGSFGATPDEISRCVVAIRTTGSSRQEATVLTTERPPR